MSFPLCRYALVTTSAPSNVTVLCRRMQCQDNPLVRQLRPCLMLTKRLSYLFEDLRQNRGLRL
ncbi:hypothetical protein SB6413_05954 [Klebsiella pasteurii]|nr:hypothetical protein SB6413_05954 [Klebsiella pasteurii]